jgi:hypothetical protein
MSNTRRWSDRRPPGEKYDESNEAARATLTEIGSVSFGGAISEEALESCSPLGLCDPNVRKEDFHRWMLEHCEYKSRCFCEIDMLSRDFREWLIARQQVPCSAVGFTRLLYDAGFDFANGLVGGLLLQDERAAGCGI